MVKGWRITIRCVCLIYHDEQAISALSKSEYDELVADTLAYLDELRRSGYYVASNCLDFVDTATTIRVRDGKVRVTDGPFVETKEQLGGYILLEARDLNEAIRMISMFPPVRIGGIEVRPVKDHVAGAAAAPRLNCAEAGSDLPESLAGPARRALTGAGYVCLERLAGATEAEIADLHGIGPNALKTLREALAERGLSFAE